MKKNRKKRVPRSINEYGTKSNQLRAEFKVCTIAESNRQVPNIIVV